MTEETTFGDPYDVVLADLRAKRAQIDNAIAAIEALRGTGIQSDQSHASAQSPPSGTQVTPGMFHGLNIAEAAKQVLALRKKPLGTQEITEAIQEGGVVFSTKTPANTVNSVLHRQAEKVGDVIRVGRSTWALSTWYPNPGRFQKKRGADATFNGSPDENAAQTDEATSDVPNGPEQPS